MSVVTLLLNSTPTNRLMEGPLPATVVPSRERNGHHKNPTGKDVSSRKSNSNSPVPNGRNSPHRPRNYRESAENSLNFKTVQRIDSDASEIMMTVAKVVVYEYHAPNDTWVRTFPACTSYHCCQSCCLYLQERTSVEGTLFIYSRY